jgi:hypothetical protein
LTTHIEIVNKSHYSFIVAIVIIIIVIVIFIEIILTLPSGSTIRMGIARRGKAWMKMRRGGS